MHAALAHTVIPLGFEPKTHALEGRCSNPTELRNQNRLQKYGFLLILQNTFLKKLLYSLFMLHTSNENNVTFCFFFSRIALTLQRFKE